MNTASSSKLRFTLLLAPLLLLSLAGGCTREQTGAVIGGGVGAAVGNTIGKGQGRTAALIIGTMAGTMIGATIGRYMDEQDRMRTGEVLEYNRTGRSSNWRNPDSGHEYTVTPTRTFESRQGPCRDFAVDAYVGGRREEVTGTACRDDDGRWRMR